MQPMVADPLRPSSNRRKPSAESAERQIRSQRNSSGVFKFRNHSSCSNCTVPHRARRLNRRLHLPTAPLPVPAATPAAPPLRRSPSAGATRPRLRQHAHRAFGLGARQQHLQHLHRHKRHIHRQKQIPLRRTRLQSGNDSHPAAHTPPSHPAPPARQTLKAAGLSPTRLTSPQTTPQLFQPDLHHRAPAQFEQRLIPPHARTPPASQQKSMRSNKGRLIRRRPLAPIEIR